MIKIGLRNSNTKTFTLSTTRLTETFQQYSDSTGKAFKNRSNLRYVQLKDVRTAFAEFQENNLAEVPTYDRYGSLEANYGFAYVNPNGGQYGTLLPGEMAIGCKVFDKRTTSKILRAAGVKVPRKARALTATAGR